MTSSRVSIVVIVGLSMLLGPSNARAQDDEAEEDEVGDEAEDGRDGKRTAFGGSVTTADGLSVHWDLATSAMVLRAQRDSSAPPRSRNYQTTIVPFPGNYGFVVHFSPPGTGWRVDAVQLVSITLTLLARVDTTDAARSELLFGAGLSLFDRTLSVIFGVDLYRGVSAASVDDAGRLIPGGTTAFTGLFGWAFATEGEVTAENFALLVNLDVVSIATALGAAGRTGG